jgi:hypothetical protein
LLTLFYKRKFKNCLVVCLCSVTFVQQNIGHRRCDLSLREKIINNLTVCLYFAEKYAKIEVYHKEIFTSRRVDKNLCGSY